MANKMVQKDKLRSTKHTYNIKDRVTRTQLKTWGLNMSLFNSTDDGPKSLFGIYTVVVGGLVVITVYCHAYNQACLTPHSIIFQL
jgi:hypothetical protein